MRREEKNELRAKTLVASHEAGHIVVALAQGQIQAVKRHRYRRACSLGIDRDLRRVPVRPWVQRDILTRLLAGVEAERFVSHESIRAIWARAEDVAVAERIARESHHDLLLVAPIVGAKYVEQDLEDARQVAADAMERHGRAVTAVADLLLEDQEVSGERVIQVAHGADALLAAIPQSKRERRQGYAGRVR